MISVIIPTLNERAHLGRTLQLLAQNSTPHETIVSDGGSEDGTPQIAAEYGASVLSISIASRAAQMNRAAEKARGSILLFLHADTCVSDVSLGQIERALETPQVVGGGFSRRFDTKSRFLAFTCWLATLRCRTTGLFLGDQAMFIRRVAFERLNGFKNMTVFEDLDLSRRMRRAGKVVTLFPGVCSSARRFERKGPLRTTCSDLWLTCCYFARTARDEK